MATCGFSSLLGLTPGRLGVVGNRRYDTRNEYRNLKETPRKRGCYEATCGDGEKGVNEAVQLPNDRYKSRRNGKPSKQTRESKRTKERRTKQRDRAKLYAKAAEPNYVNICSQITQYHQGYL